MFLENFQAPIH